ncbi:MAG TPA: porin [Methylomirabilota bacterium]|nr:porin [Methylomirabilota bacterium]
MKRNGKATLTAGVMLAALATGRNAAADSEIERLRQQLAEQRQYMEQMEKRLLDLEGKEKERATKGVEAGYTRPEGAIRRGLTEKDIYDGGFYVRTEDGSFSLKVNGFAQVRYTFFDPEHGKSNHNFDVALARLAFSGTVFDPRISYFLQYETSTFGDNNRTNMLDWWMKYSFSPDLAIQAGRFILPYSRQFYTHPGNLLFSDLSSADYAFNLQRAVGAHFGGKFNRLAYDMTVTNSIRALDAGGQQNVGDELAVLGRLEFDVLEPYGYLESSPRLSSTPQMSIGVAAAFNPVDEASGFQNVLPGDRTTNVTLDGGFRWNRLTIQAAGYYRHNNVKAAGRPDNDDFGYYGQIGYYLAPERWELAARVSGVEFDHPNNPVVSGDGREYTVGLNYYLYGHNVKLQMDYSFLDSHRFVGSNESDHRLRVQTQFLF